MKLGEYRKAIGAAILGVYAWAQLVVASPSGAITAEEWLALGAVGVTVATVFGFTNDRPDKDIDAVHAAMLAKSRSGRAK